MRENPVPLPDVQPGPQGPNEHRVVLLPVLVTVLDGHELQRGEDGSACRLLLCSPGTPSTTSETDPLKALPHPGRWSLLPGNGKA